FGQFKRDVLEPSINEINEKTEIKANYEAIKTGRKYTNLILSWEYA
ncbi:replication initiation protein, partial [Campylobacter fetus]